MITLKKEVKEILDPLCSHVTQTWPQKITDYPCIIFAETLNMPIVIDNKRRELLTQLEYTVDVFVKNANPTTLIGQVDEVMTRFGFYRTNYVNRDEPDGIYHTQLVYNVITDSNKKLTFKP